MKIQSAWRSFLESSFRAKDIIRLKESLRYRRPVYFYGVQGSGKSTLANALKAFGYEAHEAGEPCFADSAEGAFYVPDGSGFEVFEMHASDLVILPDRYQYLISHPAELEEWIT